MTVITVLTGIAVAYSVFSICAAYIAVGLFALIFYTAKIKVYDDVADYNKYIHNSNANSEYGACNGEMFDIFPDSIRDPSKVEEFNFVYYNPWDAQFLSYLTVRYSGEDYAKEMQRLEAG